MLTARLREKVRDLAASVTAELAEVPDAHAREALRSLAEAVAILCDLAQNEERSRLSDYDEPGR